MHKVRMLIDSCVAVAVAVAAFTTTTAHRLNLNPQPDPPACPDLKIRSRRLTHKLTRSLRWPVAAVAPPEGL